ncbi:MAG: FAD-dependent oxidoreductase, partial [Pedobacter sp.]
AKMGKKVVLIEPSDHMGGHMSEGLGSADIDNHKEFRNSAAIGGMALQFYKELALYYKRQEAFEKMLMSKTATTQLWKAESSVIEKLFEQWVKQSGVTVIKRVQLNSVMKTDARIQYVEMSDKKKYEAAVFIDATYEGDLLAAAGITTKTGREANSLYGETLNGIRAETKHAQFAVKVDPYKVNGDASSGLIPTIQNEPFGIPGTGDESLQAYCFRVCLTNDVSNQIPFAQPRGYDRTQYEIYLRYLAAKGKLYTPRANLPNNKTDLGAWHDLSHNLYGMNRGYPTGTLKQRQAILEQHKVFTKGLFYFLSTDTSVSRLAPTLQTEWKKWGYAKDEFTDNQGFPRKFYVRDARRMVSDYVITEHTASKSNLETVSDPIAVAYWPMDVHSV